MLAAPWRPESAAVQCGCDVDRVLSQQTVLCDNAPSQSVGTEATPSGAESSEYVTARSGCGESEADDVFLRYLCPADLQAVKALCQQLFPIEYPDYWYTEITSNDSLYALAAVTWSGSLVGLLVAECRTLAQCSGEDKDILDKAYPANTRVAYILSLGVEPLHRRRGVATRLLDHYLRFVTSPVSNAAPIRAVYLHVLHSNYAALRFYQRHNFRRHTRLKNYYRIMDELQDGYTYVLYVNGAHPPWSLRQCVDAAAALCARPFRRLVACLARLCRRGVLSLAYTGPIR